MVKVAIQAEERTAADLEKLVDKTVEHALRLNPAAPVEVVADIATEEMPNDVAQLWSTIVLTRDLAMRVRAIRRAQRHAQREKQLAFSFPTLHEYLSVLPVRLRDGTLQKADYRQYLADLNSKEKDRREADKKQKREAVQAILDLWPEGRANAVMTLAEVDAARSNR